MSELKPMQLPPVPGEADVLRRMLNTPPTPHVKKKPAKRRKTARPAP